jgi:hypothetical protein
MLQDKKLQFQRQLEEYLEDQKVYDIFEDMMKGLIVSRPKDPLKFLVSRLTSPESKLTLITLCRQEAHHCGATRQQAKGDCPLSR